jgi:hypothetical protein
LGPLGEITSEAAHLVTRSRAWNITERVEVANVGNEIEQGMGIPTIRSPILLVLCKQKERNIDVYSSTTKDLHRMHMDRYGSPDSSDDDLLERFLGNVWSILEPSGNTLKGS